ncbi:RagB/SusD family nutrient uptake outer membrane protein [Flavitalea sp. BT771]|uniref:RagB/SusD family nutrient uptake outer membrane protein n=1 Tax=Flavitalea sp. BT771 TaxID=3063329 RepID=UPI0026E11F2D|nr:RagB/SusD family nutrient uptake outer membrane protein [Flavitalea sp. BT771]MDO6433880.1 RagB/SusD family nutrient uptake outer membrane protein [Flavitalea sp. BT771]MDV6222215.1 RagB/SusD family nutrient uptake outer membrane protein [Flavitalea sp. BT771]
MKRCIIYTYFSASLIILGGCKKLVHIAEPTNSITTSETFSSVAQATAAVTSIYNDMSYSSGSFFYASGATTIYAGMSADELNPFGNGSDPYFTNELLSDDGTLLNVFWAPCYYDIYMANACIEGIQASKTLPGEVKKQLIGESKFLRAFCYFYLVNLFGDVPLVTSTAFVKTSLLARTSADSVYQQMISDLTEAKTTLPSDYSLFKERIRATSWAASALLARAYLYKQNWSQAVAEANLIINQSSLYNLDSNLNDVFLMNGNEAILQWQDINQGNFLYATQEGNLFIPYDSQTAPYYTLTDQLLGAFEPGDKRRESWVDSVNISGTDLFYPHKYKVRDASGGSITEYYTILRLAEQYLIRAEANAQMNKTFDAIGDLNIIRKRAGLSELDPSLSQAQVLEAVAQERRIEFFAEWGHRWFDLKRTGKADVALSTIKPSWQKTDTLYPIPHQELLTDPNLTQNPGYGK